MAGVARANVERQRPHLRCGEVSVVRSDVLDYEIPDDVTVVYLYNPFQGEIFAAVVEKLVASLDRNPRRMRIVYRTPLEEDKLLATGRFRRVRAKLGPLPWSRASSTRMYEAVG